MHSSKKTVIDMIDSELKNHPEEMNSLITKSQKKLTSSSANRVFNDFPCLVPEVEFEKIIKEFDKLLNGNPCIRSIRSFEKKVIDLACNELLEKDGCIKKQVLKKLHWKQNQLPEKDDYQMDNYTIVSAFVGTVHEWIVEKCHKEINKHTDTFPVIMNTVNPNYGKWILETMNDRNMPFDEKYDHDALTARDILLYPARHPLLLFSVFVGGIVGAAIYGGGKLVKHIYDENVSLPLPENTNAPSNR